MKEQDKESQIRPTVTQPTKDSQRHDCATGRSHVAELSQISNMRGQARGGSEEEGKGEGEGRRRGKSTK